MATLSQALGGTLLGIDHVGLAVPDLDAAIIRWSETFGLVVSFFGLLVTVEFFLRPEKTGRRAK